MIAAEQSHSVDATPIVQSLRSRLEATASRPWPDRPVPVVLAITDLDIGGAERALVALATRLDRRRWRPSVICLGPEAELAEELREANISVQSLSVGRRNPVKAVRQFAKALQSDPPELVQSFLFHANVAAKLAATMAGRPRVVGGIRVAERRNRWHLNLERITQRLACGMVCVSEGVRRHAVESGHLDPDRLVVIPNGIDPKRFDDVTLAGRIGSLPESQRVILFVGRIEPQKGVSILLDAFARVAPALSGWSLVIVGDGPDRDSLCARSKVILGDRVAWLGRRRDVPKLMAAADLVVLPSLWEGMPNVVLEAMASGTPVIGTRVEGTEELVTSDGPERTGWLAVPGEVDSLAEAIRDAVAQSDQLPQIGSRGRDRASRIYSLERVVAAYETVWAACLGLDRDILPVRVEFGFKPIATASR